MDEDTLIRDAQKGDLTSFNRLVLTYQSQAYNIAFRIMGESDAAEDATQEAFISAYRNIKRFRGGSFKSWVFRIVTNACYDQLRVKQRRPTNSLDALPVEADHTDYMRDHAEQPDEVVERQELNRLIQAGISTLPPEQRVVLVLSDVQGMSYQEIAEVVDLSLGTVKSRLSRGRAKLRDYLLERGELLPHRYRLRDGTETREAHSIGGGI